jgi:hypothetical protein
MIWQDMNQFSNQEKNLVHTLVSFQCKKGQYNEVAS